MSTKTKTSKKTNDVAGKTASEILREHKERVAQKQRTKHMFIGLGVITFCSTAIVAGTKALYDVASEAV